MKNVKIILMIITVLASIVISFNPIGPCDHEIWQIICYFILFPIMFVCSLIYENSWHFQHFIFIPGIIQAILIYYIPVAVKRVVNKIKKLKSRNISK